MSISLFGRGAPVQSPSPSTLFPPSISPGPRYLFLCKALAPDCSLFMALAQTLFMCKALSPDTPPCVGPWPYAPLSVQGPGPRPPPCTETPFLCKALAQTPFLCSALAPDTPSLYRDPSLCKVLTQTPFLCSALAPDTPPCSRSCTRCKRADGSRLKFFLVKLKDGFGRYSM